MGTRGAEFRRIHGSVVAAGLVYRAPGGVDRNGAQLLHRLAM